MYSGKDYSAKYYKEHKALIREISGRYRRSTKGRFAALRDTAKQRDITCTLTLEQYEMLIHDAAVCYYCGGKLAPTGGCLGSQGLHTGIRRRKCGSML